MAKQRTSKGGTSRIRFIMLDAELPEGDLSQITSAIQNALKPTTIAQPLSPPRSEVPALSRNGAAADPADEEPLEAHEEAAAGSEPPRAPRETRTRKPTIPKVLDLDLSSDVSLENFVNDHPPKSEPEKHLVVAAWFKQHRDEDAVTVGHVYTCYRELKWPSNIGDFSWPLRHLKKEQLMTSTGRGRYAINNLGVGRVQKMQKE